MSHHKVLSDIESLKQCNKIISGQESKFIFYEKCELLEKIESVANTNNMDLALRPTGTVDCISDVTLASLFTPQITTTNFKAVALIFTHSIAKSLSPIPDPVSGVTPVYPPKFWFKIHAIFQDVDNIFSFKPDLMKSTNYKLITQAAKSVLNTTGAVINDYHVLAESDDSGFIWEDIQFHQLLDKKNISSGPGFAPITGDRALDRIEVGLWELLELIRYSDYIGISGARVSTGSHRLDSAMTNFKKFDNADYFTLKFTGFRKEPEQLLPPGIPKDKIVLTSNNSYNERFEKRISGSLIPATVWGSPCPPHWIPQ